MNPLPISLSQRVAAATATLSLALLAACGGGGGADATTSASSTTERAASFTQGPITGFGSIIVNGVRLDDSSASVSDDDGGLRSRSEFKLGMQVSVDGTRVDSSTSTAKALKVRFGHEILGPVSSINAAGNSFVALGQTVDVSSSTVFSDGLSAGLGALAAGNVVEVHAVYDAATGRYAASRVELKTAATAYTLRGVVASLNATATTFSIGAATINYGGVSLASRPSNLADGVQVRVRLATAQSGGQWVATSFGAARAKVEDVSHAHLRGTVSAFTSTTSFSVNGTAVDATNATFPDGTTGLALGARVEVEGALSNGVLVATKVELDTESHAKSRHGYELHGSITSVNSTAKTFLLRGITVNYGGTVEYRKGTQAGLVAGAKVEVKGTVGTDRSTVTATRISFED